MEALYFNFSQKTTTSGKEPVFFFREQTRDRRSKKELRDRKMEFRERKAFWQAYCSFNRLVSPETRELHDG